ncbi:DNA/RNA helicase domain-containing protein [Spiroplasma endosymbiont of Aspidapion aeneum]|uniref:DNA/RNA helicase domain-containing protein n=1 Tax=Spiroplasma endosymbiont of Aspidapion aeneum TaxID=3066276 RepID=UPI00313D8F75
MIIYTNDKENFIKDVTYNKIGDILEKNIYDKLSKKITLGERISWENSLKSMALVLQDSNIDNTVGINLEYKVPGTNKRVDMIITGVDQNENRTAIIVELKQWRSAKAVFEKDGLVLSRVGNEERELTHPSQQVLTYKNIIEQTIFNVNNYKLKPCAFLHNYIRNDNDEEPLLNNHYKKYTDQAPIFFKYDVQKFVEYINKSLYYGDSGNLMRLIENSELSYKNSIQDKLWDIIASNYEFSLVDSQKIIYENILYFAKKCKKDLKKRCIIVNGQPGTGKTAVLISALGKLLSENLSAKYIAKSSSIRNFNIDKISKVNSEKTITKAYINKVVCGSGSFISSKLNEYNCLLVDEAHRLCGKSGIFKNVGDNQIREIMNSSNLAVFFVDDNQLVTTYDIGSKNNILKFANEIYHKDEIYEYKLDGQFRANGSNEYINWIESLLYNKDNYISREIDYDFKVYSDISVFKNDLHKLNTNNNCRIVANYNWNWVSKNDHNQYDICIESEKWQWNLKDDKKWAYLPSSFEQVGSIFTCQGLEFEYCGVIIGDMFDIVDDKLVTRPEKKPKSDSTSFYGLFAKIKKNDKNALIKADQIIRNSLYVLLTRGVKGTYVYFTNPKVKDWFIKKIENRGKI